MNQIETHILEIHCETDVTDEYIKKTSNTPKERLIEVEMTVGCYGIIEKVTERFWGNEWELIKKNRYYLS